MSGIRTLIENYWINSVKNKETFMKTKKEMGKYRKFVLEQLGWRIISNERVIKIEKIPAYAKSYMGITEFTDIMDYCIFSALLIYLEDKEDQEQFLLSELVGMIEIQLEEYMEIDWTMYTQRKSLIRALTYAESMGLLIVYDGSCDSLSGDMEHEVLYENTGLSRYFASSFNYDIAGFKSFQDFEEEQIKEAETDRGHFRTNRVYRQLVSAPAMYWNENDDPDVVYLKNQRQWINKNLNENLGGQLHLHKNAAFFVMEENDNFGDKHPKESMISELVLLVCQEIRDKVNSGEINKEGNDCVIISREDFDGIIEELTKLYGPAWSKEYREMETTRMTETVLQYMESWMLIKREEQQIIIYPAAGKFTGKYPQDFDVKEIEEDE